MSKLEAPLTEGYWRSVGGTLVHEFRAVQRTVNQGQRLIDGVIIQVMTFRLRFDGALVKSIPRILISAYVANLVEIQHSSVFKPFANYNNLWNNSSTFTLPTLRRIVQISADRSKFLDRSRTTANAFDGMFDFYVACFCERDDLLNQWRLYADAGGGFALGFKTKDIGLRWGGLQRDQDFFLRKVIYEEGPQRRLVAEVLDKTMGALASATQEMSVADANNLIARCCGFVRAETAEYLMCFKHPAFVDEQEWRICHITEPNQTDHVKTRDGPYGLTPYVSLDPTPQAGVNRDKLPLSRITHGPTADSGNVRYALQKLLQTKKYAFVEITGSTLPIRVGS